MPKGILQITDALSSLIAGQLSVINYGEQAAYEQIQEENAAYNRVVKEEQDLFMKIGENTAEAYGAAGTIEAENMTELDKPDDSKIVVEYPIGFPLTRHGNGIGYTRDWLASNSTKQLAAQYDAARSGDMLKIQSKIRRALYYPISRPVFNPDGTKNTSAYVDRLQAPNVPLPLYPLLNADGNAVPIGPNGETFDPTTHQHYMASDWTSITDPSARDGIMQTACQNLIEHKITGGVMLAINSSDVSKVKALPEFQQRFDETVHVGIGVTYAEGDLDILNFNNRCIGTYLGFEVWVKPWTFPGYIVPMATGDDEAGRLMVWRTRKDGLWADFNFREQGVSFPLIDNVMTRDGDCSVWMRHLAVVLYIGGPDYVTPANIAF